MSTAIACVLVLILALSVLSPEPDFYRFNRLSEITKTFSSHEKNSTRIKLKAWWILVGVSVEVNYFVA